MELLLNKERGIPWFQGEEPRGICLSFGPRLIVIRLGVSDREQFGEFGEGLEVRGMVSVLGGGFLDFNEDRRAI